MMGVIPSVRLRRWLPLFFGAGFLLLIGLMLALELFQGFARLDQQARAEVRSLLVQYVLPLRRALESQRPQDVQSLLGSLSLRDDLDAAALTDTDRRVLYASHYAWQDRPLIEFIPEVRGIDTRYQGSIVLRDLGHGLLGVEPIEYTLADKGRRVVRQAQLWLLIDTQRSHQGVVGQVLNSFLGVLLFALPVMAGMVWSLYRYVGAPLIRLNQFTHRLAGGDYQARLEVRGEGEVAELARGLQHMGQSVHQAVEALSASEQRLSVTLDSIGDAVLVTDTLGLVTRLNPEAERLTGWSADEAVGRPIIEIFRIVNAETREPAEHPVGRVLREGRVVGLANHTTLIARDGEEYQIADSAAPIRDGEDRMLGVIMVFQDVTERYRLEGELNMALARLQALTDSLPDPCFVLSEKGEYLEVFGGSDNLLAESRERLLGRRLHDVLPAESAEPIMETLLKTLSTGMPQRLEYSLKVPAGEIFFEGNTTCIEREEGAVVVWQARDITRRKAAEEGLSRLAKYDQLTGLSNRGLMVHRLQQALARCRRTGSFGALLFIDLDRFKDVNDSFGHLLGDQLLTGIAERLRQLIRTEDLAARFGGDEFVLLLEDVGHDRVAASEHAESVAMKLRDACARPFDLGGHAVQVGLSMGIVIFPDDHADAEELIKRADIAMYRAKETGRNQVCFFSHELQQIAENRIQVQRDLCRALQAEEMVLYVQPRVDVDGQWIGGEVLVRWQHPERGLLMPSAFIPIAEESGLIVQLDSWIISHAIDALAEQVAALPEGFGSLSLNLTEPLMMREGFVAELKGWLLQSALEPGWLEFEITERLLLSDHSKAAVIIDALRELGIRFSVDDFGTGCSSLRYLQRLPLDTLKIDKSFIDRLPGHSGDATIVATIIDMARHLALDVVAEGVESRAQQDFLEARGCRHFQGYQFARPMPWAEFFARVADHAPSGR